MLLFVVWRRIVGRGLGLEEGSWRRVDEEVFFGGT
jgi:hypothetical protein